MRFSLRLYFNTCCLSLSFYPTISEAWNSTHKNRRQCDYLHKSISATFSPTLFFLDIELAEKSATKTWFFVKDKFLRLLQVQLDANFDRFLISTWIFKWINEWLILSEVDFFFASRFILTGNLIFYFLPKKRADFWVWVDSILVWCFYVA